MNINWKKAFWVQFIVSLGIIGFLGYCILDQAVTLTYQRESYEDTESDLIQISEALQGRVTRDDFMEITKRFPDYHGEDIELNQLKISFEKNGTLDSITSNW